MLRVARLVETQRPGAGRTTWLAAHAVPKDFDGAKPDAYIDDVCHRRPETGPRRASSMPWTASARASPSPPTRSRASSRCARRTGPSGQAARRAASNLGGTALAARSARSRRITVEYWTQRTRCRRHRRFRHRRGAAAGRLLHPAVKRRSRRSPPSAGRRADGAGHRLQSRLLAGLTSLLLTMNMGCTLFRLTPEEALAGATRNAARALGVRRLRRHRAGACAPTSRSGMSRSRRSSLPHRLQPAA
jgi:imidazolonepropionase